MDPDRDPKAPLTDEEKGSLDDGGFGGAWFPIVFLLLLPLLIIPLLITLFFMVRKVG